MKKNPLARVSGRGVGGLAILLILSARAFNEFGVQIMSPHFEAQPSRRIVVAKPQWYEPPAKPGETSRRKTPA
jgi:hypothetical protein